MSAEEPVKLLWTGGWDSTFRLLQLLLDENKEVQPFYIIDPSRNSIGVEIQSMDRLSRIVNQKYPNTERLLLPIIYINLESIEPDEEIANAYKTLKQFVPLGKQYQWLSLFCKQNNYQAVEIAVENVENEKQRWADSKFIRNNYSDDPASLSEKERVIYTASKTLYKNITFPIINYTKQDMFATAKKNGWMPVMQKTWFCYQPLYLPFKGLRPCGNCITCRIQMKGGLTWRVPFYVKVFQKARIFKKLIPGFF